MTAKHTPGPWTSQCAMSSDVHNVRVIWSDTGGAVASVRVSNVIPQDEALSNAQLIAAAPELLAALEGAEKALIKALPHLPADSEAVYCGEWLVEIRAAIAKARGE